MWPTVGNYCISERIKRPNEPDKRHYWRNYVYPTIAEAVIKANELLLSKDVYFAVLSLAELEVRDYGKPDTYRGTDYTIRTRVANNALASRNLFLDLDVGDGDKKYATQALALEGLERFSFQAGMPEPMVVSSGGGLHVYWRLDTDVPVKEWVEMAARLKAVGSKLGLKYDPSRTTDAASVLRVAGTFNLKDAKNPRPVEVLRHAEPYSTVRMGTHLNALAARLQADVQVPRLTRQPVNLLGLPSQTIESDFTPEPFADVVKSCGQVREFVRAHVDRTHPNYGDLDNPTWYRIGPGVIGHCENGPAIVRELTEMHPRSAADVEAKLEQALRLPPTKCQTIAENAMWGDGPCKTCPARAFAKNPHMAARKSVGKPVTAAAVSEVKPMQIPVFKLNDSAQSAVLPPPPPPPPSGSTQAASPPPPPPATGSLPLPVVDMPVGYVRSADGIIYQIEYDEEGEEQRVMTLPWTMYCIGVACHSDRQGYASEWVSLARDDRGRLLHPNVITIPNNIIHDEREMKRFHYERGIQIPLDNWKDYMRFANAFTAKLQKAHDTAIRRDSLGWADDGSVFVLPDKSYHADGSVTASNFPLGEIARTVSKAGTMLHQKAALDFYFKDTDSTIHQATFAASLGSILMKFTGQVGMLQALVGESGAAKSTLLNAAASLWGKFDTYVLNGTQGGATKNYIGNRIQVFSNLPTKVDEVTHLDPDEAAALSMKSSQATGRGRLNSDGSEKRSVGEDRSSIIMTTSNRSMYELLGADGAARTAGHMRVVEIELMIPTPRGDEARAMMETLEHNYGHIGPAFAAYVVTHKDQVSKLVRSIMSKVEREIGGGTAERFYVAWVAVIVAAAEISRMIGLLDFDVDAIYQWAVHTQIPLMRGAVTASIAQPGDILSSILRSMNGSVAVVDGPHTIIDLPERGEVRGMFDRKERRMYVPVQVIKDALKVKNLSRTVLDHALGAQTGLMIGEVRIAIPTRSGLSTRTQCYVFDTAHRFFAGRGVGGLIGIDGGRAETA